MDPRQGGAHGRRADAETQNTGIPAECIFGIWCGRQGRSGARRSVQGEIATLQARAARAVISDQRSASAYLISRYLGTYLST